MIARLSGPASKQGDSRVVVEGIDLQVRRQPRRRPRRRHDRPFEGGLKGDRLAFLDGFTRDFFAAGDRTDLVSEPQRGYARDLAALASPKGTLDCIAAFGRTDFRGDLAKIDVPTLITHGNTDGIVPFEVSGKRSHEAIANGRLVIIEGGPHGVNASHAAEWNAAVLDFLAA